MKISALRSDEVYRKIMRAPEEEKRELYRTHMLEPFRPKWDIQQIPFRAAEPGGFDVLTLNDVLYMPPQGIDGSLRAQVEQISADGFWNNCEAAVRGSLAAFERRGIRLPVREYLFTVLLGNPGSRVLELNAGYSGDGGIPGYVLTVLNPNAYTLPRIAAALAHECNHNVRYQFIRWDRNVTLGELVVSEGLAENFAVSRCGEDMLGPWVSRTGEVALNGIVKPALRERLQDTGWDRIAPCLYGDEIAGLQGFAPAGLPYGAGYACGYDLIRHYLRKTGASIEEATLAPCEQILRETEDYWSEQTFYDRA